MALTLAKDGLDIDITARRAVGRFYYGQRSDLPDLAASVSWVKTYAAGSTGEAVGGNWYVANISLANTLLPMAVITARQPGTDWTWLGLTPIQRAGTWTLIASGKQVTSGGSTSTKQGFWPVFSNFTDAMGWTPGTAWPVSIRQPTWIIEFVDTTRHDNWLGHKNGTWPSGIVPQITDAGAYLCVALEVEIELYTNPLTGSTTTLYRHFATFNQAPIISSTQMTWGMATW